MPEFFEKSKVAAELEGDTEGIAMILNEEIGYYRQLSMYDRGIESGKEALSFWKALVGRILFRML